jgi:MYXO-CTERM domain-containing protein
VSEAGAAASDGTALVAPADDTGGCACSTRGTGATRLAAALGMLLGLLGLNRRRRRTG